MTAKHRVGIVGLDHWYTGLEVMRQLRDHPRAELVAVAHRDLAHAREPIEAAGAVASDDYAAVASRDDLDLIVTTCPTAENVALCSLAARAGKHILSVKPYAMNLAEAATLVGAVKAGGGYFMSFESMGRLSPATNLYREWVQSGRLGAPISAYVLMRGSQPTQLWPGVHGRTWWLDPAQVFGGGWVDHAIYQIDSLRYILGSEVIRISGEISNKKLVDEPLEDFGVANVVFGNGCVATIEVTWSTDPGAGIGAFHLVGSQGQIVNERTIDPGKLHTVDMAAEASWQSSEAPDTYGGQSSLDHMLDCIDGLAQPIAGLHDSFKNLEACLAFYQAAKTHTVVHL